jgi:hypothetical protein
MKRFAWISPEEDRGCPVSPSSRSLNYRLNRNWKSQSLKNQTNIKLKACFVLFIEAYRFKKEIKIKN